MPGQVPVANACLLVIAGCSTSLQGSILLSAWACSLFQHCLAFNSDSQPTSRSARSVAASYKPPMLVTRVRLPACAAFMQAGCGKAGVMQPLARAGDRLFCSLVFQMCLPGPVPLASSCLFVVAGCRTWRSVVASFLAVKYQCGWSVSWRVDSACSMQRPSLPFLANEGQPSPPCACADERKSLLWDSNPRPPAY